MFDCLREMSEKKTWVMWCVVKKKKFNFLLYFYFCSFYGALTILLLYKSYLWLLFFYDFFFFFLSIMLYPEVCQNIRLSKINLEYYCLSLSYLLSPKKDWGFLRVVTIPALNSVLSFFSFLIRSIRPFPKLQISKFGGSDAFALSYKNIIMAYLILKCCLFYFIFLQHLVQSSIAN